MTAALSGAGDHQVAIPLRSIGALKASTRPTSPTITFRSWKDWQGTTHHPLKIAVRSNPAIF
jgi:hypothetical protein